MVGRLTAQSMLRSSQRRKPPRKYIRAAMARIYAGQRQTMGGAANPVSAALASTCRSEVPQSGAPARLICWMMSFGVVARLSERINAAVPATIGAAIEVPLQVA